MSSSVKHRHCGTIVPATFVGHVTAVRYRSTSDVREAEHHEVLLQYIAAQIRYDGEVGRDSS